MRRPGAISQDTINSFQSWLPIEAPSMTAHLRMMAEKGDRSPSFDGGWMLQNKQHVYWERCFLYSTGCL